MTVQEASEKTELRLCPPPPSDFDPFTATKKDFVRHGLPLRPDSQTQPGMAALWDRLARRYRGFDHIEPRPDSATADKYAVIADDQILAPIESCGYSLVSLSAPFTALFVTWTVPDLQFNPSPIGPNHFHTFAGLGFLDVHVEMTVDSSQNVTSRIWVQGVGDINLPVGPGDVVSAALCLVAQAPGAAHYFLANETKRQTMNFTFDTGYPPAVTIDAGVTRGDGLPLDPLADFGAVYFDEISAYTTEGSRSLTSGQATTMTDEDGSTLARPVMMNDYAFKVVYGSA